MFDKLTLETANAMHTITRKALGIPTTDYKIGQEIVTSEISWLIITEIIILRDGEVVIIATDEDGGEHELSESQIIA